MSLFRRFFEAEAHRVHPMKQGLKRTTEQASDKIMDFPQRPVMTRSQKFHPYGSVLAMSAAALLLIAFGLPGQNGSSFAPLLYLPLVVATMTWRFEAAVALGLVFSVALTALQARFLAPAYAAAAVPAAANILLRIGLINLTTILGAYWARKLQEREQEVAQRLAEADSLLQISLWLETSDGFEDAAEILLLGMEQIQPYCVAALFTREAAQEGLTAQATRGRVAQARLQTVLDSRFSALLDGGETARYIADIERDPEVLLSQMASGVRAALVVPMTLDDGPANGLLYLGFDRADPLTPEACQRVDEAARRFAFALQRARLQERLAAMAYMDANTQLPNARAFRRHLADEMRRAVRYQRPLALIMLDLDNFKSVNDRFGHPVGDRLLAHVGGILREKARATDTPARYGGEEFALLCPETDAEEAAIVAERIRTALEDRPLVLANGQALFVTISGGVAATPEDAAEEAELLDRADAALYAAKRGGKNRIACAVGSLMAAET